MRIIEYIKSKSKFYPYIIAIAITVYIVSQFITIMSTSNVNLILKQVAYKQNEIFSFLVSQSLKSAIETASIKDIEKIGTNNKEELLHLISFNDSIKVYDINFIDAKGIPLNKNEDIKYEINNEDIKSINSPSVLNIRNSKKHDDVVMDIGIPIFENGKIKCIMIQTESFERINMAMKEVSILKSGESYIIDKDGRILTDLKKIKNDKEKIYIHENKLKDNIVDGFESKPYLDYNDEYVYGYHVNLNLNDWKLIVEIDENEIKSGSKDINKFLIRSITLCVALSKIIEPLYNRRKREEKIKNIECDKNNQESKKSYKFYLKEIKIRAKCIKNIYRSKRDTINILVIIIVIVVFSVVTYITQVDKQIQHSLNSTNKVNARLINYYVKEFESQFKFTTSISMELEDIDINELLKITQEGNLEILNLIIYDDKDNVEYSVNIPYINEAQKSLIINDLNNIHSNINISQIFYDKDYKQYVYYMSSKIYDEKDDKLKDILCIISIESLIQMLNSNEINSSTSISILDDDKIMYSNTYKEGKIPVKNYEYVESMIDENGYYDNSIFEIEKHKNMNDVDVYADIENIQIKDYTIHESYFNIGGNEWKILYEEPVDISRERVFKNSLNLLLDICFEYIENIIKSI